MKEEMHSSEYATHKSLIERVRNKRDEQSWAEFCDTYDRYIYTILRNMGVFPSEADDLRQEIMIKLWKGLEGYDPNRGVRFRSWLSTIVTNCVRDDIRKRMRRTEGMDEIMARAEREKLESIRISDVDQVAETAWRTHITAKALKRIEKVVSANAMKVFRLSLDGMKSEEIAQQLDIRVNSVYRLRVLVKNRLIEEVKYLQEIWD
jgi:RNA polymerase sigma-70 factor (ECF subfamily)